MRRPVVAVTGVDTETGGEEVEAQDTQGKDHETPQHSDHFLSATSTCFALRKERYYASPLLVK